MCLLNCVGPNSWSFLFAFSGCTLTNVKLEELLYFLKSLRSGFEKHASKVQTCQRSLLEDCSGKVSETLFRTFFRNTFPEPFLNTRPEPFPRTLLHISADRLVLFGKSLAQVSGRKERMTGNIPSQQSG